MQVVDIRKAHEDKLLLGEYGFELATLTSLKINIPPSFVVTTEAYFEFLKENNLVQKIKHLLENFNDKTSAYIKKTFLNSQFSEKLVNEIFNFYKNLGWKDTEVTLYPSLTDPYLKLPSKNAKGEAVLVSDIKDIWASFFDNELLSHRHQRNLNHFRTGIAIVVTKNLKYEKLGSIESGEIKTSSRLSEKEKGEILEIEKKIKDQHYFSKKVNWTISSGKIYVVSLATLAEKVFQASHFPKVDEQIIAKPVSSMGSMDGILTGVIGSEIMVIANLDYHKLKDLKSAKALVIESDVTNPHLKIILQKMGIPVVIVTGQKINLKNGQVATVDGRKNMVYKGDFKV